MGGAFDDVRREEAAVFAEGNEDDAVEEFLGDVDGLIEGFAVLGLKMFDQADALIGVIVVKDVADFLLARVGAGDKFIGAGDRGKSGGKKS